MSTWLTARELAGLPGLPGTEFGTRKRLAKLEVANRPRPGRGGGLEYDCTALPAETRKALVVNKVIQAGAQIAARTENLPVIGTSLATQPAANLPVLGRRPPSTDEKACADARLILVSQVVELAQFNGVSKGCQMLALQLLSGQCSTDLQQAAKAANKRARTAAVGERTLYRWMALHQKDGWWGLLPAASAQERLDDLDQDVMAVLGRYHSKDARFRNLTAAAKHVTKELGRDFDSWEALYARSRRALSKVDKVDLIKARHSGSERAAKLPFKRRDTSILAPLDVCLVDGHSFKAKVRHPDHGAPFAPEVTVVIDAATRRACGWSTSLSENTIAVGDALRHAVGNVGIFGIVYSDNGPGEKAKVFDCPVDGIIKRLGSEHRTGIPGHPQGHGLIERSWRTHMINIARQFGSFQGSDVDGGTFRKVAAELAKEQRAVKRSAETGDVVTLSTKAPTWKQFCDAVDAGLAEYNATHRNRNLPKRPDGKHMTPDEAWAAMLDTSLQHRLDPMELRMTFMPSALRVAQRGEVVVFNNRYQAPELMGMGVDGKQLSVRYDIHDPTYVMVYTTGGEFVCEAKWNANRIDYYAKPVVVITREKRADAAKKRREAQIELSERERLGYTHDANVITQFPLPAQASTDWVEVIAPTVTASFQKELTTNGTHADGAEQSAPGRPFFDTASERYEWLMNHRAAWTDADTNWTAQYVAGSDYAGLIDYYTGRGLAWVADDVAFKGAR